MLYHPGDEIDEIKQTPDFLTYHRQLMNPEHTEFIGPNETVNENYNVWQGGLYTNAEEDETGFYSSLSVENLLIDSFYEEYFIEDDYYYTDRTTGTYQSRITGIVPIYVTTGEYYLKNLEDNETWTFKLISVLVPPEEATTPFIPDRPADYAPDDNWSWEDGGSWGAYPIIDARGGGRYKNTFVFINNEGNVYYTG